MITTCITIISLQALACPSELLDCKVRLRGIYVCGDSSAMRALACRGGNLIIIIVW